MGRNINRQEHTLKSPHHLYEHVLNGVKTFEIRKNDRNYRIGDILTLREWIDIGRNGDGYFTGREVTAGVVYITDYQQKHGYVVLGIIVNRRSIK